MELKSGQSSQAIAICLAYWEIYKHVQMFPTTASSRIHEILASFHD